MNKILINVQVQINGQDVYKCHFCLMVAKKLKTLLSHVKTEHVTEYKQKTTSRLKSSPIDLTVSRYILPLHNQSWKL